ncbi:MAG: sulfatase-like hydrolase/transferase [Clostridia bacterium]|nr:sulfatase-like hydrolase/transferase [Deltaproteobacteria bacterium]
MATLYSSVALPACSNEKQNAPVDTVENVPDDASESNTLPEGESESDPAIEGASSRARPHLVVLMLDDVDGPTFDRALSVDLLPNIKKYVVDQGVNFSANYATDSICCPSRTTFFTGQYAHNHGVRDITQGSRAIYPDDATGQGGESTFLPVDLQSVGYNNALFGKYLNGYGEETADAQTRIPPGWNQWLALQGNGTYNMYEYPYNENGTYKIGGAEDDPTSNVDDPDYQTDFLARQIAAWLSSDRVDPASPQFIYMAPTAPHIGVPEARQLFTYGASFAWPVEPPHRYMGLIDGDPANGEVPSQDTTSANFNETDSTFALKPGWMTQNLRRLTPNNLAAAATQYKQRLASFKGVDDLVGTVAAELEARGMLANTVFIITADNGFLLGEHRLSEKGVSYEEAIRVPLVVRTPYSTNKGNGCSLMAANTDLAATLLDYGQAASPRVIDGRSLRPLIATATPTWNRAKVLIEHFQENTGSVVFDIIWPHGTVRTRIGAANTQYTHYQTDEQDVITREFYDLATDGAQVNNLQSGLSVDEIAVRDAEVATLQACSGDACLAAENSP